MPEMVAQILQIIAKLKVYQRKGCMYEAQIAQIAEELTELSTRFSRYESELIRHEMMRALLERFDGEQQLKNYTRGHLEEVAQTLGRSERTVYRRLKSDSFSDQERKLIRQRMENS